MTQKEKQLLLKDLCARLPYGVKGKLRDSNYTAILKDVRYSCFYPLLVRPLECPFTNDECSLDVDEFKPYLRQKVSMSDEEMKTYRTLQDTACSYHYEFGDVVDDILYFDNDVSLDYLNSIHIDYRGLIPMGLALEAIDGMYETE